MINDRDKRAIESMVLCGCDMDTLKDMFPKVPQEELTEIYTSIREQEKNEEADFADADVPACGISVNCS